MYLCTLTTLTQECPLLKNSTLFPSKFQLFHINFLENSSVLLDICPPSNQASLLPKATIATHYCIESLKSLSYKNPQLSVSTLSHPDNSWFVKEISSLSTMGSHQVDDALFFSDQVVELATVLPDTLFTKQNW